MRPQSGLHVFLCQLLPLSTYVAPKLAMFKTPKAAAAVIDESTSATFLEMASPPPRGKLALTDWSAGPQALSRGRQAGVRSEWAGVCCV